MRNQEAQAMMDAAELTLAHRLRAIRQIRKLGLPKDQVRAVVAECVSVTNELQVVIQAQRAYDREKAAS